MANDRLVGSKDTQNRAIYLGTRTKPKKYTIEDIERGFLADQNAGNSVAQTCAEASQHREEDLLAEDAAMMDVSEDLQVQTISNIIGEHRQHDSNYADLATRTDQMDMDGTEQGDQKCVTAFVVDTNFIISHLSILEDLRTLSMEYQHQIVIPRTVVQELDGLKNANDRIESNQSKFSDSPTIGALARKANDWIYTHFSNLDSAVVGQRLNQRLDYSCRKDDSILDCCLYYREKLNLFVILMSNDKNLCLKALTEKILTVSFRPGMSAELIATRVYQERSSLPEVAEETPNFPSHNASVNPSPRLTPNQQLPAQPETHFQKNAELVYTEIEGIALSAIDHIMHVEYGDELDFTDYNSANVTNLRACCRCVAKFWTSVFGAYFKGTDIGKQAWKTPGSSLVKIPSSVTELEHFVEFWVFALQCFYKDRDNSQKEALNVLSDRWNNACLSQEP
ncbi:LAME_0D09802g1_1 [Lachancea meyersii CBS 8951]|uniref:Transcriptional protein SWT1 n=1 Tax=Lachancea meyersii CBS 8951 TaxID=1266667 RepID=A0A1G4JBW7_9SACH|nr:LAME_0D09802g1_1 [Lachancea meyersii CBS 8951]